MVEDVAADLGEGLGLALGGCAVVVAGAGPRVRVDERGDGVEHGGVVEAALETPTRAVRAAGEDKARWSTGEAGRRAPRRPRRVDQLGAAGLQLLRIAVPDPGRELGLGRCPLRGCEPARGVGAEHPRDDLDLPQRRVPGREHRGGGGQPRRQQCAVEPDPRRGLFGRDQMTPGAFPAEQIAERGGGGAVATLGERAPPLQIGQRADRHPVDTTADALREREHADQFGIARRGPRRPRCATASGASCTP